MNIITSKPVDLFEVLNEAFFANISIPELAEPKVEPAEKLILPTYRIKEYLIKNFTEEFDPCNMMDEFIGDCLIDFKDGSRLYLAYTVGLSPFEGWDYNEGAEIACASFLSFDLDEMIAYNKHEEEIEIDSMPLNDIEELLTLTFETLINTRYAG